MGQVSPYLRRCSAADGRIGYGHYCPGCDGVHIFWTAGPGTIWAFNQNPDKPSFAPSMRVFHPQHVDDGATIPEETLCHYILTDGMIAFCPDGVHALVGTTVPLPALPSGYHDDEYGWPGE